MSPLSEFSPEGASSDEEKEGVSLFLFREEGLSPGEQEAISMFKLPSGFYRGFTRDKEMGKAE